MAKSNQHVIPHADGWAVRSENTARVGSVHSTQEEAILRATEIAKQQHVEVLIHGRDGQIRERNSFGNDPFPPKG